MEIPVINRMTEFEASINSFNNPSLISRFFSIFEVGKIPHPQRLLKWGALLLALLYAFSSVAYKFKILFLHFRNKSKYLLASSEPLLSQSDDAFYSEDDDDDDVVCSSSDDDDEEAEDDPSSSHDDLTRFDYDFRLKGSFRNFSSIPLKNRKFNLRRRRSVCGENFSLSDLVKGNGVVKLWDGFSNNSKINSILGPAVSISPAVIVSAGAGNGGMLGLGLWDLRIGRPSPEVHSEWQSDRRRRVVTVDPGRTGKVYVRDDVSLGLAVGDVRNVDMSIVNSTEYGEDAWWDANGVEETDDSTTK